MALPTTMNILTGLRCAYQTRCRRPPFSSAFSGRQNARDLLSLRHPHRQAGSNGLTNATSPSLASYTFDDSDSFHDLSLLDYQIDALSNICEDLRGLELPDQVPILRRIPEVAKLLKAHRAVAAHIDSLRDDLQAALLSVIACGQQHVVTVLSEGDWQSDMTKLAEDLLKVMHFYDSLGGIIGYQLKCLVLIRETRAEEIASIKRAAEEAEGRTCSSEGASVEMLVPQGPNFRGPAGRSTAHRAAGDGLHALPHLAEIYPLGGAGDRLGLMCEQTGEPLPAAMLPYCGRPMLEGLIRDLRAREYLYYHLFGEQHTTPVAIMTSDAKGNHARVSATLECSKHFGRPASSFRLFCQPLVPVIEAESGLWVLPEPLKPSFKPGGHGAIWKLMADKGIFGWLKEQGREAALIRQISNPMASTDFTLLALAGVGHRDSRAFGFASCNRVVGAAEGMNVLMQQKVPASQSASGREEYLYGITNVEYTEFERLGIRDQACSEGSNLSCFPANTNILYVDLQQAEAAVQAGIRAGGGASLPGMIFNLNKRITYNAAAFGGEQRHVQAGRMECTMQNLADSLVQRFPGQLRPEQANELSTFVVYNERRYVTSSAKRKRAPGSTKIHQTPDGSFLDLMHNARDLLEMCGVDAPSPGSVESYLAHGPRFIFLFNPALGPLWQVIAQKLRGGRIADGSEVVLEVAELCWERVDVEGSLLINCSHIVGHMEPSSHFSGSVNGDGARNGNGRSARARHAPKYRVSSVHNGAGSKRSHIGGNGDGAGDSALQADGMLRFSNRNGRVRLHNVRVRNAGVDFSHPDNRFWSHTVHRREACRISLSGRSEFCAQNVTISGDATFHVPDGFRMVVSADPSSGAGYSTKLEVLREATPSWEWRYSLLGDGTIALLLEEGGSSHARHSREEVLSSLDAVGVEEHPEMTAGVATVSMDL